MKKQSLRLKANIEAPDDVYQMLLQMHDGRSDEDSLLINAKLILILANHIGDQDVIAEAIEAATKQV
ncbi:MAG: DUF2783 domain-containing protein [Kordiimonadaceae bacterium]|nr:DUF2783 domain-containing protein [Kordiimonadaceae bacterium]